MSITHTTPEPVLLDGFQAILKPGKFGTYNLVAVVDESLIDKLEEERVSALKWAESKLKNKKRASLKPTPWEEVSNGKYTVKFSWKEKNKPPVLDTEGSAIVNKDTPIYSGSMVKLAFKQKPYVLQDEVTYGTTLRISAIQVVSLKDGVGMDTGDMNDDDAAKLFGTCNGFKTSAPNIEIEAAGTPSSVEDDDF